VLLDAWSFLLPVGGSWQRGFRAAAPFFNREVSFMPVYEKEKPKRMVRFLARPKKRRLDPVTGELKAVDGWKPQTLRAAPKGVGKKRRPRPPKQQKQMAA
jgi:hypothetical protein